MTGSTRYVVKSEKLSYFLSSVTIVLAKLFVNMTSVLLFDDEDCCVDGVDTEGDKVVCGCCVEFV